MGVERVLLTRAAGLQDGLQLLGVDCEQSAAAARAARVEPGWRESAGLVRQEGVAYSALPILLDGVLNQLADPQDSLKKMSEMIRSETENNLQIWELVESEPAGPVVRTAGKVASLFPRRATRVGDSGSGGRLVYCLLVSLADLSQHSLSITRVDVTMEASGPVPAGRQLPRWLALQALEPDLGGLPRPATARLEPLLCWRQSGPAPPLVVEGREVAELRLVRPARVTRTTSGLVGVKEAVTELANCGERGEPEILTRLEDKLVRDGGWDAQLFQLWTAPAAGCFTYNLAVFLKGGTVYRAMVDCVLARRGADERGWVEPHQLEMLQLVGFIALRVGLISCA